jgi:hypothetical protein
MNYFIIITVDLFIFGFLYGLLCGNDRMHWLVRSLAGGTFFAFFYIAIPVVYLQEYLERRKDG